MKFSKNIDRTFSIDSLINKRIPLIEELTAYTCIIINRLIKTEHINIHKVYMYIYVKDRQKMLVLMAMMACPMKMPSPYKNKKNEREMRRSIRAVQFNSTCGSMTLDPVACCIGTCFDHKESN